MLRLNGQLRLIEGGYTFESAFCHKNKKVRNRAHRKLIEGLGSKGYYSGGIKPIEPTKIPLDPFTSWGDAKGVFSEIMKSMDDLKQRLDSPKSYDFYENPDLGQRISLKDLIAATLLWPLEEVFEIIPTTPAQEQENLS
jgi:hypothetical protein